MTTLRTAAQQALEALEFPAVSFPVDRYKVADALRAALVEPVQEPKPVAWMYEHDGMVHDADNPPFFMLNRWATPVNEPYTETPLYTAPSQRKPLSEEEIEAEWRKAASEEGFTTAQFVRNFARAIERAHGIV